MLFLLYLDSNQVSGSIAIIREDSVIAHIVSNFGKIKQINTKVPIIYQIS